VRDGKADVGLIHAADGWRLVGKTDVKSGVTVSVTESGRDRTRAQNAAGAGTTVAVLTAGGTVPPQVLEPDADEGVKVVVGLIFSFLFYFASIMFGMAIATSVVEEKQSRVVEILVSAVPLRQLLAGKVLGNVALALAQMVLFVGVGLIGMAFTSYAAQVGLVAASAGWFLVFFVAGFAALACLWAVAGSLATRNEDLQSTTPVLTTILMVAMFVGLLGEGTVRVVGSYIPVVSAISMPQRLLAGEAAWWEPIVSLLVTLAFAAWTMVIGERLYRRSILHTGRRLGVREALTVDA
jgi:ABC-2 type transport system permease protein